MELDEPYTYARLSDINLSLADNYSRRAGVIPFTIANDGEMYFMLGRDAKYRQFTDFGGGGKKDETLVATATREFNEEAAKLFHSVIMSEEYITRNSIIKTVNHYTCYFLPVPNSYYFDGVNNHKTEEIDTVRWFSYTKLVKIVLRNHSMLWGTIRKMLRNVPINNLLFKEYLKVAYRGVSNNSNIMCV